MKKKDSIIKNEIKSYLAQSGWSLTDVVKELNKAHPDNTPTTIQNIANKISRGTIKYSEVKEIASIIGYNLAWVLKKNN